MEDPGDPTPNRLRRLPTWLLGQANARSHRLVGAALARSGATGYQFRLLAALDQLGPASQAALGRAAGLDRSDVAVAVAQLEERGALRRSADPGDLRRNRVALTPAGRRLLARLDTALEGVQEQFLGPLSDAERSAFVAFLDRLQQ